MDRKFKIKVWVTAGLMLLASSPAFAAGLGRLTVMSTLGQPFRAEIDLLTVDKKDLGSIQASFASPEAFREAKIERSPVLSSMRFSVEQKKNGDPYLKIVSAKPIDEPFLDMLIQFDWPSGRLVREYTVLLDPPGYSEQQVAVAPVALPATRPEPVVQPEQAVPAAAKPVDAPVSAVNPENRANIPLDKKLPGKGDAKAKAVATDKPAPETYGPVKKGENLSGIAASLKPGSVDLEQMLVALFQSNKQAFTGDNMNRLKAGQILRIPAAGQIEEVKADEAARQVKAHSADWNAYRQKLAASVEAKPAQEAAARQAASGKITTAVEDKAATKEPAKDVLRLSRNEGASGAKAAAGSGKDMQAMKTQLQAMQEEATAREKAIKEANQRIADLEKNIKEMQRLLELRSQGLADLQKQAAVAKVAPVEPTPAAQPASKPDEKPADVVPTEPKKPAPIAVAPKQPELSPLDEVMAGNPLYLGGGAIAVLLLGLFGSRAVAARRRKAAASFVDSVMTEGDFKANTVLGSASGGRIDTGDTSFLTDFSQAGLGSIDSNEVDPIAEAEVYMAYGRDAQAEEILKEALVKDSDRHEIRLKLLEIYAGRNNLNAFEAVAGEIYTALNGQASPVWDKAAEMGRELDSQNPLYSKKLEAAAPAADSDAFDKTMIAAGGAVAALAVAAEHEAAPGQDVSEEVAEELNFNLDAVAPAEEEQPVEETAADLGFNLDIGALAETGDQVEPSADEAAVEAEEPAADMGLDFNLDMEVPVAGEAEPASESLAGEPEPEVALVADEPLENVMELDFNTLFQGDSEAPAVEEVPAAEETPVIEALPVVEEVPATEENLVIEETPVVEEVPSIEAALSVEEAPVIEEAPAVEEAVAAGETPAHEEGLISADSWRDEVMRLDLEAAAPAVPVEAPGPTAGIAGAGDKEDAIALDLPDFLEGEGDASASKGADSTEPAVPSAEGSLLEYDFDLGHEETAAPEEDVKGSVIPDLDFSSINLEMDRPVSAKADDLPDNFGSEEVSTKLDLARAYKDMGDKEGARDILQEVLKEGSALQLEEAGKLLAELD
ncbi:MAG: hypothetical protein PHG47_00400 [Sulfuricella sp.]|nr:hypothetical protein [Sulfuricella sp.]